MPDVSDLGPASARDIADVPALEIVSTAALHLMSAAAVNLGHHHAAPLRDGLRTLQLAFREVSEIPDAPGEGPGEKFTGPVSPTPTRRP